MQFLRNFLYKLRKFNNRWQHVTLTYPTLLAAGGSSIILPVLLLLLAQEICVYEFWSYVHSGVPTKDGRIVANVVHTSRIQTTVAEGVVLTHHLRAIHVSYVIR